MSTLNDIKRVLPEPSDKIADYAAEVDRLKALKLLLESEGGQELLIALRANASRALTQLVIAARADNPDMNRVLALVFDYAANMDLAMGFSDVGWYEQVDKQLEELVSQQLRSSRE